MSEHKIPDDLTEWLQLEAADRRKQADARLQYAASGKNLSPADRKAAQLIAEQMAGRKLPKSNALQEEAHAQEQERIAKKLNSQAEKIEGFVERIAKLEAALARMQQPVTRKQIWFDEWRPIINAIGEVSVQEAMDAIERDL